jgi:hypothetical protein
VLRKKKFHRSYTATQVDCNLIAHGIIATLLRTALALLADLSHLPRLMVRSRTQLAAENLFLRKQLACYIERQVRPRRTDDASRIALALLSQLVGWRELLTIVRPETLVRWHRDLFRLFWRRKSRHRGRPRIPADVERLIAEMAMKNRTWDKERIAAELRVKLGLTLSPRTCDATCHHSPGAVVADQPNHGPRSSAIMPAPYSPATSSSW